MIVHVLILSLLASESLAGAHPGTPRAARVRPRAAPVLTAATRPPVAQPRPRQTLVVLWVVYVTNQVGAAAVELGGYSPPRPPMSSSRSVPRCARPHPPRAVVERPPGE
jgi:hypothetical protein